MQAGLEAPRAAGGAFGEHGAVGAREAAEDHVRGTPVTFDPPVMDDTADTAAIRHAAKTIKIRPNDRLIRSALVILGVVWWCDQGAGFMPHAPRLMSRPSAPVTLTVAALGIFLLVWFVAGADVFVVCEGILRHERRIGALRVWPSSIYKTTVLKDLRVEERAYRIKGNTSRRFEVVFDDASGKRCLVWRRSRAESNDVVRRLLEAMIASRSSSPTTANAYDRVRQSSNREDPSI